MASGNMNEYVEGMLTDSVLNAKREAFYFPGSDSKGDYDNSSSCSTTAQNSLELSLEPTNSADKVTTSAVVVSDDEFEGNVYDTLSKSSDSTYAKSEFNLSGSNGLNMLDPYSNNLKGHTPRDKSPVNLEAATNGLDDKEFTVEKPMSKSEDEPIFEPGNAGSNGYKVSEGPKGAEGSATTEASGKIPTSTMVGDVYLFLLQMKLLNTLDLVRAVCKPWGVPPSGDDYVFHFDQIASTTTLSLLQKYEDIFAPIYGKFSSGNPKLLWTKIEDVDYFKIVFRLECLRHNQTFNTAVYNNILRYTLAKLDNNSTASSLESLNSSYPDSPRTKDKICRLCGNILTGKACRYCTDSLDNTPTKKGIISEINLDGTLCDLSTNGSLANAQPDKGGTGMDMDGEIVDEWPSYFSIVEDENNFTLSGFVDTTWEDEMYHIYQEDITSSFKYSAQSLPTGLNALEPKADGDPGNAIKDGVANEAMKQGSSLADMCVDQSKEDDTSSTQRLVLEEVDLTSNNSSLPSSNNNTRLISTDNVDTSEVDVTTNSNVDFSENFVDNTTQNADGNLQLEKEKLDEEMLETDNYGILDENILSTINEELLKLSDEDILEEQYLNNNNQDLEKIILSVLNRKLNNQLSKYKTNKYPEFQEGNNYLMSLYNNYDYEHALQEAPPSKAQPPKLAVPKYQSKYASQSDSKDTYRNTDKYAYIDNKYSYMENRYNYIDYPDSSSNYQSYKDRKKMKTQYKDPDYQYPYNSYKDLYKNYKSSEYKLYKDSLKDEKRRKRRLNADVVPAGPSAVSAATGATPSTNANGGANKEIKISSHVVSASVSYDKRQQRFMAQWKTKEGTKHSKSFYAKRYATPIMARKHAELYKMYILQHRVMNSSDLVEPTYEQLLANNFKELESINVGDVDYDL